MSYVIRLDDFIVRPSCFSIVSKAVIPQDMRVIIGKRIANG